MENYELISNREIYYSEEIDCYVLVIRENNKIIGINYGFGESIADHFKSFGSANIDLTRFYVSILPFLSDGPELDKITQAIWAHHEYISN